MSGVLDRVRLPNQAVVLRCAGPPSRLAALTVAVPVSACWVPATGLLAALWRHSADSTVGWRLGARVEPVVTPDCIGVCVEAPVDRFTTAPTTWLLPPIRTPGHPELVAARQACSAARPSAFDLLRAALFGPQHPYGIGERARGEHARSCSDADVRTWIEQLGQIPPVVATSGLPADVTCRIAEQLAQHRFPEHRGHVGIDPPTVRHTRVRYHGRLPGRRARYLLGSPGVALGAPEKFAVHVAWAVLAGRDGLLDQRLRRERALTYSLAAFSREFARAGYCACSVDCDPAEVKDVAAIVTATLADVVADEDDLRRARQRLIVQHHLTTQSCRDVSVRACCYEVSGVPPETADKYPVHITSVSAEDVRRITQLTGTARVEIVLTPNAAPAADSLTTTVFQDVARPGSF